MEHLASVVASLTLAKANLQEELEVVERLLQLAKEAETNPPASTPTKPLVNDKRRAAAGDKEAQKREEESRWGAKNGKAKPKSAAGGRKNHPVQSKIVDDLLERVKARKPAGKSFTPEIPGSITAQELVTEAGYSIGTVRRAIQQLEKQGSISTRKMSWKELGREKPAGPTIVLVATENLS